VTFSVAGGTDLTVVVPLLYVAVTVYVPGVTPVLGKNPSPVPLPVPGLKLSVKFPVWSVPDWSATVHVVPPLGSLISIEPFASAWKNTALPFIVTLWLPG